MSGPPRGHFSRSRNLKSFNEKFSSNIVENTIQEMIAKNKGKVRVLEIGCGEGRVLMELRKMFPDTELYGINKSPWKAMKGSKSLMHTGTYYKIFSKSEIKKIRLPKIQFYDAKKLKSKSNYFDLVISQVAIQYVDRKDTLLEEVWRVLKPGGKAFLNIDSRHKKVPDILNLETPRFIVYRKGKIVPVKILVSEMRKKGFGIEYHNYDMIERRIPKVRANIMMHKNTVKPLKFNLKFDSDSSFDLSALNKEKDKWSYYWGYRSVFLKK